MLSLIIIGYGTVGKSLVQIFVKDKEYLQQNYLFLPKIKAICEKDGCLIAENGLDLFELINTKDIRSLPSWIPNKPSLDVLREISADLLVECTWTNPKTGEPALSHIITAMKYKMNIVSSNKGPFYLQYSQLKQLANEQNVMMGIESTVGSAIPCIAAKRTIAGAHVKKIRAILNGTSNYILSRMTTEGLSFNLALKEAQELGYAEADPTLDIEGYDAAGKLVILANEILGWNKTIHDVDIARISKITQHAIELAKKDNYLIKHVGIAEDGHLSVGPVLVPMDSSLAVNGSLNVIEFGTEYGGPILLTGRGAGGPEAAAGILSDIIYICSTKNL
jgi:homoserine dehydrogenase